MTWHDHRGCPTCEDGDPCPDHPVDDAKELRRERDGWQHKANVVGAFLLRVEQERDEAMAEVARLRAIETAAKAWRSHVVKYSADAVSGGWVEMLDAILAGQGPGKEEE